MAGVRRPSPDEGFTLVETLVSIAVIGIAMTALVTFFTSTVAVSNQQRGKLAAVQLADSATEQVHSVRGSTITAGRDKASSDAQWINPVVGVAGFLDAMTEVYDSTAAGGSGASAVLPTSPQPMVIGGLTFNENWYIGRCYLPVSGGDCVIGQGSDTLAMLNVVVAITWSEKHCPNSACSYVVATLISDGSLEPVFTQNDTAQPPSITNPGAQVGDVSGTVNIQVVASGGAAPVTWSAAGLPAGVAMDSSGLITGAPTVPGTYNTVITAVDAFPLTGTAAFTWTVNALPALTTPGTQTSPVGNAVTFAVAETGGTAPLTWAASGAWGSSGLPAGLALNASTGAITGSPTTTGTHPVTITVTDAVGTSATATFTWTVIPRPTITAPIATTSVSTAQGGAASFQAAATGGTGVLTWSAVNLPTGVTINAQTGLISGTASGGTRFLPTVTVTDANGAAHAVSFEWKVTSTTALRVTAPADRSSDKAGTALTVNATAAGGTTPYKWTAVGLPAGLSMTTAGVISGTPTAAGTSVVTLTVKDNVNASATLMFVWTVK